MEPADRRSADYFFCKWGMKPARHWATLEEAAADGRLLTRQPVRADDLPQHVSTGRQNNSLPFNLADIEMEFFASACRQTPRNEESRREQRGIFVGSEIYFTGGGRNPRLPIRTGRIVRLCRGLSRNGNKPSVGWKMIFGTELWRETLKNTTKWCTCALTAAALVFGLASCQKKEGAQQGTKRTVTLAHNQTSLENPYSYGAIKFKQTAESVSGGALNVVVHHGTLGENENELVEKLEMGAVDIINVSPGFMSAIGVPEVDMLSMPYLFNSFDHWTAALDGEFGKTMSELISKKQTTAL
jgi:hypothetical protein